MGAEAWLNKALCSTIGVSCWLSVAGLTCLGPLQWQGKSGLLEKGLFRKTKSRELLRALMCGERAPNHDLFGCMHVLSDWRLSWFTRAPVLNAFLAGGSDDAWADAEDISEEDSALRFVCITGMRKRKFESKLTGSATQFCSSLGWALGPGLRPSPSLEHYFPFEKESWMLMAGWTRCNWSLLISWQRDGLQTEIYRAI